ncbi:hypothetical protein AVEN_171790-1 [Araneus ventricosus]|uniref:DUF4817 domain-containing protein n=1 Tax=Araneus ventricosus TaxID=182803 RepID=A0A4Y2G341_ARAVE|nr:hypothetical protein AVEN_171790-1 [Araneus ventricosus]
MASRWPSDHFLFSKLKEHLSGTRFSSDSAVKTGAKNWLNGQGCDFYQDGLTKLVLLSDKCLNRFGVRQNRLYREHFPDGPHPTRRTILKVVKRLRETGCVTSRLRIRRPRNVGRNVQPEDVLAYFLAHPQSSTKMISENCGLSISRVWTILNESGAHPYHPYHPSTPVQGLLPRDFTHGATL